MSTLKVTNIAGLSGSSTDVMGGLAKAWVNFNGTGTIASRDSFNVSGLVDNGSGDYTTSFTSSFSNSDYSFNGTSSGDSGNYGYLVMKGPVNNEFVYATSSLRLSTGYASDTNSSAVARDAHQVNSSIHGDLA